jgi:hypothetical protein
MRTNDLEGEKTLTTFVPEAPIPDDDA